MPGQAQILKRYAQASKTWKEPLKQTGKANGNPSGLSSACRQDRGHKKLPFELMDSLDVDMAVISTLDYPGPARTGGVGLLPPMSRKKSPEPEKYWKKLQAALRPWGE